MPARYPPGVNPYAPQAQSSSSRTTQHHLRPSASAGASGSNYGGRPSSSYPSSTSSSARNHGVSVPRVLLEDVDIEDFAPPEWRTVLNSRIDLGYPDFYPSRPGFDQPEDVLTEENVKNGFTGRNFVAVGAEVFSMHGPIHQHLSTGGLNLLQQLGKDLIQKRQELMPQIGERTFRIPIRVTYNDTKRSQFLADLSNPKVPLHRLMRTPVPHGFKGVELLDSMYSPSTGPGSGHNRNPSGGLKVIADPIPIDRALWFIRVLGANEISAHRGRTQPQVQAQGATTPAAVQAPSPAAAPTPTSTTTHAASPMLPISSNDWYTQEFTNTFIAWLRTQLTQLALPPVSSGNQGISKPGIPPPKAMTGVLSDEKARGRWLAKWDYTTRLMRELSERHLLSSRLLTGWLADFLSYANLAQLGFAGQMIGERLPDMIKHLCNARFCLRAACEKLIEVRASPAADTLVKVETMLVSIIQSLYEANPEVMLNPTTWRLHLDLLFTILPTATPTWVGLQRRNEALWFKIIVDESSSSPRRQQMAEIQKLDSICEDTNMAELAKSFFDGSAASNLASPDPSRLEEKIFTLLNWAMGLFQLGCHRPYAVYTILKLWHESHEEYQSKQMRPHVIDFFPILYKWLDTSSSARKEENVQAIGITFGELTRQGMFSYGQYLQALIAHGQTARSQCRGPNKSHHMALLRALPIFVVAKDLNHQRRIALCGDDVVARSQDEAEESEIMDQFKDEVMEYVPEVFGLERYKGSSELRDILEYQLPSSTRMSRYLYVQARFWLAPDAGEKLKIRGSSPPMDASTFARILQVFRTCRGFATIADFVIRALQDSDDDEILDVIIDTVRRDADVWTSMDGWSRLGDKLLDRYHALQTQGRTHPRTLEFLVHLAAKGRLSPDEEDEIKHLQGEAALAYPPLDGKPKLEFKDSLSSLQAVLINGRHEAAVALGPKLYTRHGSFSHWSTAWWTTIVDLLHHPTNQHASHTIVPTTLAHIVSIKKPVGNALDSLIETWLGAMTSAGLIDTFGKRSGASITHLLLELVVHRCLSAITLLEKAVFPIWKHVSGNVLIPRKRVSSKQIQAVVCSVNITARLLVSPPLGPPLPPDNLVHALVVLGSRQTVFCGGNVQNLIKNLPLLVVLEKSNIIPEPTTTTIGAILKRLAMTAEFKTAAFRNLNVLKDAFLSSEWSKPSLDSGLEAGMVDTLKLIMSEKPPVASTPASKPGLPNLDNNARFSAWRWTRIVLEMRVEFKGLATRIANNEEVADARQTLNRLVHATLDRETTTDDTDLLCEAFGGMDSVVTQEILAAGMDRLSNLLSQAIGAETQLHLESCIKSIDQVLRILDSTYRQPAHVVTDTAVIGSRHRLLDLLGVALQSIERQMSADSDSMLHHDLAPPRPGDLLKVVLNLLKFTLGVLVVNSTSPSMPKPNFPNLAVWVFKVIVACQRVLDDASAQMMLDMLMYIIDCTPPQARLACQMALLGETTTTTASSALSRIPALTFALPHLSPIKRDVALIGPDVAEETALDSASPLDDRKWELFEQMAPRSRPIRHQDLFLSSAALTDTSSIPMALFNPTMTRDSLPGYADAWNDEDEKAANDEETMYPWEDMASERNLGDGFAGEPVFARQLASALYDGDGEYSLTMSQSRSRSRSRSPNRVDSSDESVTASAPLSSLARRMSTRIASHTHPTSGGKGSGSNKDPISIDEDESESDDPEAMESPPPPSVKRPRTSSKSTASGRQTTGGKAPAQTQGRKTTGGKGVSTKATSGKSVRGTAAKDPKGGGRRKSQAE